ncbi:MAG: hypothetical protein IH892_00465 [Planctomycetes bacterium]|nr:hypothetical protein [Planctomycetota bacterium]
MAKLERLSASPDLTESSKALQADDATDRLGSPADTSLRHSFFQTLSSGDPLSFAPLS